MNRKVLVFICLVIIEQILTSPTEEDRVEIYLPMKKDHKYGDDICYYREINEKLDYAVYYVRPCEKGQYCEDEVSSNQPFGFCRDIETNITDFPSFGEDCSTNAECPNNMICSNGKCKRQTDCSSSETQVLCDYNSICCRPTNHKQFDENKYCEWNDGSFLPNDPKSYIRDGPYNGKYPGLPKECGIIRFKTITDVVPTLSGSTYPTFTRYVEEGKEWCTIGEAKDGDFVTDSRFCKSGFSLKFYPNGDIVNPNRDVGSIVYPESIREMCVTPTQIDFNNPLLNECLITYKGADGTEHKYNVDKVYGSLPAPSPSDPTPLEEKCDKDIIIKSQIYSEFIDEFNNASEEDKKDCYRIPQGNVGNCQNVKLLKLYYFYNNVKEYLFYKDRKDLEKVLHYKIQEKYHRYYELSNYLNLNYLFFFLILILL